MTIEERAESKWEVEEDYNGKVMRGWVVDAYIQGATEQKEIDFVKFQSFLSARCLLFGKYTKANGDTGYKTLDDLWEYFNMEK